MTGGNGWIDFPLMYHSMAALSTAGGYFAFVKKGSRASLIGSIGVALMYEASIWMLRQDPDLQLYGLVGGTLTSAFLAHRMLKRAVSTGSPIPATIATVSFLVASTSAYHTYKRIY